MKKIITHRIRQSAEILTAMPFLFFLGQEQVKEE